MFPTIVANNEQLCTFVEQLELPLSAPQLRHVTNVADGLLVTEGRKTIAAIHRQFVDCPDPSNMADAFRIAPWQAEDILNPLTQFMIEDMIRDLRAKEDRPVVLVGLDDSLAIKDPDTRHLQGVDFHRDHAAKRRLRGKYQNALAYLECTVMAGGRTYTFAAEPYLRERTVRRLNRQRRNGPRLRYKSKYRLARQTLERLRALLPNDVQVYVLCDAWYASARLIKYCRRQGWRVICRVHRCYHPATSCRACRADSDRGLPKSYRHRQHRCRTQAFLKASRLAVPLGQLQTSTSRRKASPCVCHLLLPRHRQ